MSDLSDIVSAAAFAVSAFSLYQTTLKRASLKLFVSPVIRYASPYQNSNFEAFAVPVTVTNEGARTGTIVSMDLQVRAPERNTIKRFFSADIGQWSIEKNRSGDFRPFAPIVLAGRTSQTETILFHARRDEPVMQIIDKEGSYEFMLALQTTLEESLGFFGRLRQKPPKPLFFEMVLPVLDHRAFTSGSGTLPLHHKNFQTSVSAT
jgi:hypothetical protein